MSVLTPSSGQEMNFGVLKIAFDFDAAGNVVGLAMDKVSQAGRQDLEDGICYLTLMISPPAPIQPSSPAVRRLATDARDTLRKRHSMLPKVYPLPFKG